MRRRSFLGLIGGTVALWPVTIAAQRPTSPLIGFLNSSAPASWTFNANAFRDGLRDAGFVEGNNLKVEYRWAQGRPDRLPALASELVRLNVVAVAAIGDPAAARAIQSATETIPIVFAVNGDPVSLGLVDSMDKPGRNLTGVTLLTPPLSGKRVALLKEIAPQVQRIGFLMNPADSNSKAERTDVEAGARTLGVEVIAGRAQSAQELSVALAQLAQQRIDGLVLTGDPLWLDMRAQIMDFAKAHVLPAMYPARDFLVAGGLASYGPDVFWMYHQAGRFVGRILKGEKPLQMPVLQPTEFSLVINVRAAKNFGVNFSQQMLSRADELME